MAFTGNYATNTYKNGLNTGTFNLGGILNIAHGGTGLSTVGPSGEVLVSNGTTAGWAAIPPVGDLAGGAAVGWIASKLGIDDATVEGVTQALTGSPEMTLKLKELDLEYAKLDQQDRDSARKAYSEVATSEYATKLDKAVVPILALGTVGIAFLLIGILMFKNVPTDQQQIIIFALGFITSASSQVLSFYFGSSQGSKDKTKEIEGMLKK